MRRIRLGKGYKTKNGGTTGLEPATSDVTGTRTNLDANVLR
jgi:hypothetical protein